MILKRQDILLKAFQVLLFFNPLYMLVFATLINVSQHIDLTHLSSGDVYLCLCMLSPFIENQVKQFLTMMWFSQSRPSFT